MEGASQSAEVLKKQIAETEYQLARLKVQLASLETVNSLRSVTLKEKSHEATDESEGEKGGVDEKRSDKKWPLSAEEYKRYGRQMIVPTVGLQGTSSHLSLLVQLLKAPRSTTSQGCLSSHSRSRWSRLPSSSLPSRCRSGHHRNHRRRYRRDVQSSSSDTAQLKHDWDEES